MSQAKTRPDWGSLYDTAAGQSGYFTTAQAAESNYSPQLLAKYLANGRIERARRGIYRIVHYPAGDHEDLMVHWLWTERLGVFSHETALMLQDLSGALPSRVFVTLPEHWRKRRLRVPTGLVVHFADVPQSDRAWAGGVPVTNARRTLADCTEAWVPAGIIAEAVHDAQARGLLGAIDAGVREYLAPYGWDREHEAP